MYGVMVGVPTAAVLCCLFSSAHCWAAPSIWRRLLMHALAWEVVRALAKLGIAIAARRPMMATTIMISTSVKPDLRVVLLCILIMSSLTFQFAWRERGSRRVVRVHSLFTNCLLQPSDPSNSTSNANCARIVPNLAFTAKGVSKSDIYMKKARSLRFGLRELLNQNLWQRVRRRRRAQRAGWVGSQAPSGGVATTARAAGKVASRVQLDVRGNVGKTDIGAAGLFGFQGPLLGCAVHLTQIVNAPIVSGR